MGFHPDTDRGLIFKTLEENTGPLTCHEIAELLPRPLTSKAISSNVSSLRLMGYVRLAGEKPNMSSSKHGRRMIPAYEFARK